MDLPDASDTIQTLCPDASKQGARINRERYELVRSAIVAFLYARGALTFTELGALVEDALLPTLEESATWYYSIVELDLEARGEIRRVAGSRPPRIELTLSQKGK